MDIYAAQWIGTTWQESTDKMKLTSRPSTTPPINGSTGYMTKTGWYSFPGRPGRLSSIIGTLNWDPATRPQEGNKAKPETTEP